MAILLLIRHGLTDQTGKRLYGRSPGVHLSDVGRRQAEDLGGRLEGVGIAALYTSPMERCRETAQAVAAGRRIRARAMAELNEIDYGSWAGRSFTSLQRTRVWRRIRSRPSEARFPGGETLWEAQARTVRALEVAARRHPRGVVALVTHGDVVRLGLAHFAGIHIDLFQRIEVAPASLSAIAVGDGGPRILRVNDTGALGDLVPRRA